MPGPGGSFWVDSAESSEKRTSDSGVNEPSAPTASATWHSPRRSASTPSWMALPPEAQAVLSEIGEPSVPKCAARRSPRMPYFMDS